MSPEELCRHYLDHPDVVTDSRKAAEGSIFFALQGEHFDGNDFAAAAIRQGASFAVVDKPDAAKDERYILVEDGLQALQDLAKFHRMQLDIPIIGITGSNGKTTTKELAAAVLSRRYLVHATQGNLNNHIGVPLTLLALKETAELGIIEMGANHPGEIAALCNIALPDYGIITNIGKAHLEGFGSLEGVKQAKKELYDHLNDHGGIVFYNGADPVLTEMLRDFRSGRLAYGEADASLCKGSIVKSSPGLTLRIDLPGEEAFEVETSLVGHYNLANILAAVALAVHFRIPSAAIRGSISAYQPRNMRSQRLETEQNEIILDAYNANPSSMRLALEDFLTHPYPAKIAILGDMLELGAGSREDHQEIVELLRQADLEGVYLVGPAFAECQLPEAYQVFPTASELKAWLKRYPLRGKFILMKASRGVGLEILQEVL